MTNDKDEYRPPEEAVSDAPDFIKDEDQDFESAEPEPIEGEECPDCGSNKISRIPRASSPDDFTYQYVCGGCGTTWED